MSTGSTERFTLIREPAAFDYRVRLADLSRVGAWLVDGGVSGSPFEGLGVERHELEQRLRYCKNLRCEATSARVLVFLEGVDDRDYMLRVAIRGHESGHEFDVFANSASESRFHDEGDSGRWESHYKGTGPQAERFVMAGTNVDLVFLAGLDRIVGFIRQNQEQAARATLGASPADQPIATSLANSLVGSVVAEPIAVSSRRRKWGLWAEPTTLDAGFFAYAAGILGAALTLSTGLAPGWLGFAALFLPASAVAAWVVTPHG